MNRATLVYITVIIVSAAGLWLIVRAGQGLRAPTDLSGVWFVGGEDPNVPDRLGQTVDIEQSGRFVRLNFQRGLRVDVKLKDAPADANLGDNLDMIFEGPDWKLAAFGAGAGGPLIFRLTGPEKHTFTVTRRPESADSHAQHASASLPDIAETATADADETGAAETAASSVAGNDAP